MHGYNQNIKEKIKYYVHRWLKTVNGKLNKDNVYHGCYAECKEKNDIEKQMENLLSTSNKIIVVKTNKVKIFT